MGLVASQLGSLPAHQMAPLDYRYLLDGAMPFLIGNGPVLLRSYVPALTAEARQRLPSIVDSGSAGSALLIEPQSSTHAGDLRDIAAALLSEAPLIILYSRPLARLLPERNSWQGSPLGLSLDGSARLRRALRQTGFVISAEYGSHSFLSIALNMLGGQLERRGRPDLADRIGFAARLRYGAIGPLSALGTVSMLLAQRRGKRK